MYANRYAQPTRFNPVGLGAAIAINAAFVAALILSAPQILPGHGETHLRIYPVVDDPPPPPLPTPKAVDAMPNHPTERVPVPKPEIATIASDLQLATSTDTLPPVGPIIGRDISPRVIDPPLSPPLPVIEPQVDPRYADALQPIYPAAEQRAAREGRVTIRVLIGVDGRVKQAERVSATSDAFWQATLERALAKWRFRPGTRGGIPVEAWRTMALTFVMRD